MRGFFVRVIIQPYPVQWKVNIMAKKLTDKQERFCQEYLIDLNATQSAIRAGYSEKTARQVASENLSKPNVQEKIAELKLTRSEKLSVDAAYVLHRHVEIDQMDMLDICRDDGSLKPMSEWPKVWRQYLSGFDISEIWEGSGENRTYVGDLKKIKWPDKIKNLELLGKHVDVQAYKDKVDINEGATMVPFSIVVAGVDKKDD